jgi:hypothetical protein
MVSKHEILPFVLWDDVRATCRRSEHTFDLAVKIFSAIFSGRVISDRYQKEITEGVFRVNFRMVQHRKRVGGIFFNSSAEFGDGMSYSQKNEPFSMGKSLVEISAGSRKRPVQVGEFVKEILESLVIWGNRTIVDGVESVHSVGAGEMRSLFNVLNRNEWVIASSPEGVV